MWAARSPAADPSPSSHSPESASPAPAPAPPDSLLTPSSLSSGSLPPDSLQSFPGHGSGRESPSIQCDSLECPGCRCGSLGSVSPCEDSLQPRLAACNGAACFGALRRSPHALSDSLEAFGAQHDSLQSVPSLRDSLRSSSVAGDSLESLSSLSNGSASLEFSSQ